MRGSLGEKIGEGGSADMHAWAPGQVVKLFKPARERQPAPEVFDEVTLEGRGVVAMAGDAELARQRHDPEHPQL